MAACGTAPASLMASTTQFRAGAAPRAVANECGVSARTTIRQQERHGLVPAAAVAAPAGGVGSAAAAWVGFAAAAVVAVGSPGPAQALEVQAVFTNSCAGCHSGGSNIIRRDATLQLEDLRKYGLADSEALYQVIYSGKGSMPGYGQDCAPKGKCTFGARLADEDIRALAAFVLASAEQGWPQQ